jgi:hypothetical protein
MRSAPSMAVPCPAREGTPWKYFGLGHGFCTCRFFEQCPHRTGVRSLRLFTCRSIPPRPADGSEGKPPANARRNPLDGRSAGCGQRGTNAVEKPLDRLADVPTPAVAVVAKPPSASDAQAHGGAAPRANPSPEAYTSCAAGGSASHFGHGTASRVGVTRSMTPASALATIVVNVQPCSFSVPDDPIRCFPLTPTYSFTAIPEEPPFQSDTTVGNPRQPFDQEASPLRRRDYLPTWVSLQEIEGMDWDEVSKGYEGFGPYRYRVGPAGELAPVGVSHEHAAEPANGPIEWREGDYLYRFEHRTRREVFEQDCNWATLLGST